LRLCLPAPKFPSERPFSITIATTLAPIAPLRSLIPANNPDNRRGSPGRGRFGQGDRIKVQGEITQIRQQQFTITLAAVTFFGVVAAWILPDKRGPLAAVGNEDLGGLAFALSVGLLFILVVLFFWIRRLTIMVMILSAYLEVMKVSAWEVHYNEFSRQNSGKETQRRTTTIVFLVLGIFAALSPMFSVLGNRSSVLWDGWWLILGFCLLIYIALITAMGFSSNESHRAVIKSRWSKILEKQI
jgi:hypothetical protein